MELPALLHKSLLYTADATNEEMLYRLLEAEPSHLINFLTQACEDETWAENHPQFMRSAIVWVTEQFYYDRLMMPFAQHIAKAIRPHFTVLEPFLPTNLTFQLKDKDVLVNGLLYGSSSEFLRELLRRECRDRRSYKLLLKKIPHSIFSAIHEYINKGTTFALLLKDEKELIKVLNLAISWDLTELSMESQRLLKKYLTRENVLDTLLTAHNKHREVLKEECFNYINALKLGCRFEKRGPDTLAFEFLEFTENSMEIFDAVKEIITHLICGGDITDQPEFVKVVNQCPKLICLDISHSKIFSEKLKEIPTTLLELEAAACLWMNNDTFTKLVELCPQLIRLVLTSNIEIDYGAWSALKKLESLRSLNLTRCRQISDEELKIILQSLPKLIHLHLEDCRSIGDPGFNDIPQFNNHLTQLNLARTTISDLPLIEIASRCELLTTLDLTHCENLTDGGIYDSVRLASQLRALNISHCEVSKGMIKEIQKL
jgi:F-box/leucine-rich repeat protein 2/20